jgi:hypothetical protein
MLDRTAPRRSGRSVTRNQGHGLGARPEPFVMCDSISNRPREFFRSDQGDSYQTSIVLRDLCSLCTFSFRNSASCIQHYAREKHSPEQRLSATRMYEQIIYGVALNETIFVHPSTCHNCAVCPSRKGATRPPQFLCQTRARKLALTRGEECRKATADVCPQATQSADQDFSRRRSALKQMMPELVVSKQKLRQAEGSCLVRIKREENIIL